MAQVRHDGTRIGENAEQGEAPMAMPCPLSFPLPRLDQPAEIRRWFLYSARS